MEEVFLARHGETEWNRAGRRQGQLDSPLTGAALAQARRLASTARGLRVDALFASPLGRSANTAAIFSEALGLPVTVLDQLQEVHHGKMAGLTDDEIEQAFPAEWSRRSFEKYLWRFPGGESYSDADRRALSALADIAATGAQRPLIVSHDMIGRMLRRQLLGLSPDEALALHHPHQVIFRVDVESRRCTEIRLS
jgi:broad specificity phosphatase PhoE